MKLKYLLIIVSFFFVHLLSCVKEQKDKKIEIRTYKTEVDKSFLDRVQVDSIILGFTTIEDIKNQVFKIEAISDSVLLYLMDRNNYWSEGDIYQSKDTSAVFITCMQSEIICTAWFNMKNVIKFRNSKIDVKNQVMTDIESNYPDMEWGLKGHEFEYWDYSTPNNDTAVFYLQIDNSMKQFPIDKSFYGSQVPDWFNVMYDPWRVYGAKKLKKDTVIVKPLYSPLDSLHMNCYLWKSKPGLRTLLKEVASAGKQTTYDTIKIGEWHYYSPIHELVEKRYYDQGQLLKVEKIMN